MIGSIEATSTPIVSQSISRQSVTFIQKQT